MGLVIKYNIRNFKKKLDHTLDIKTRKSADRIKNDIKASFGRPNTPSDDKGALKQSIKVIRTGKNSYKIGTLLSYARYLEFGTFKMRKRPFLRPAILRASRTIKGIFR